MEIELSSVWSLLLGFWPFYAIGLIIMLPIEFSRARQNYYDEHEKPPVDWSALGVYGGPPGKLDVLVQTLFFTALWPLILAVKVTWYTGKWLLNVLVPTKESNYG